MQRRTNCSQDHQYYHQYYRFIFRDFCNYLHLVIHIFAKQQSYSEPSVFVRVTYYCHMLFAIVLCGVLLSTLIDLNGLHKQYLDIALHNVIALHTTELGFIIYYLDKWNMNQVCIRFCKEIMSILCQSMWVGYYVLIWITG